MKYLDLVENLQKQEKNNGHIVIIKNGIFFISVGKDALIMNKLFGLKLTCMKNKLCKVGFQVKSVEKYVSKLEKENVSFVIYNYNKIEEKEEELIRITNKPIFENKHCGNCLTCNNKKENENDIFERLKKYAKQ